MIAGTLNEIISVYKPFVGDGKYGPAQTEYVPYIKDTRARVQWNNGSRLNSNDEVVYDYSVTFSVRYYHKIDEFMRIKWRNKFYRIMSIIPSRAMNEQTIITQLVNE